MISPSAVGFGAIPPAIRMTSSTFLADPPQLAAAEFKRSSRQKSFLQCPASCVERLRFRFSPYKDNGTHLAIGTQVRELENMIRELSGQSRSKEPLGDTLCTGS